MTVTEMISALTKLKATHGDVDVFVYLYNGSDDERCNAVPEYSKDDIAVIITTNDWREWDEKI